MPKENVEAATKEDFDKVIQILHNVSETIQDLGRIVTKLERVLSILSIDLPAETDEPCNQNTGDGHSSV